MSARIHGLVLLLGFASLTSLGCGNAKSDAASDGALSDGPACNGFPISCAQGGPSGTGVACGGLVGSGTCVGAVWTCPKGMVETRDCTCGEPGPSCAGQVCTKSGPVCLDAGVDADADAGHDGKAPSVECRGGLGEVGQGCPTMFDGAPENVPP